MSLDLKKNSRKRSQAGHENSQRMSNESQQKSRTQGSSTHRSRTSKDSFRRSKAEDERLLRVADTWGQVQTEYVQERRQLLSQKVLLQRALIAAQDRRQELIRHQEEATKVKKLNKEKMARQEVLTALKDKSRQSLVRDHKSSKQVPSSTAVHALTTRGPAVDDEREQFSKKSLSMVENGRPEHPSAPVSSPMKGTEDETEDAATVKDMGIDGGSASRHHGKQYMYGHNVGKYISPSLRTRKKNVHPALVYQTGHLSASQMWTNLWSGSVRKLLQADQIFSRDLKETFSSHVRQGLAKFRRPVFRSFTQTDDVPDLERLMDQSKLYDIRVLRHKAQLMYRSSQTNQDRTRVLLFNNPMPSISDGDDGISRFLPSCTDTDSDCTEASYLRWITHKQSPDIMRGNVSPHQDGRPTPPLALDTYVSQSSRDMCQPARSHVGPRKQPKLHFLTEKEATTEGAFLSRLGLDRTREQSGLPSASGGQGGTCRSILEGTDKEKSSFRQSVEDMPQSRGEPANQAPQFESPWQPLSMSALSEYKQQMMVEGHGEFQHGRDFLWSVHDSLH